MKTHEASRLTEDQAREYLESVRWPNGPMCPHCGNSENQYRLGGKRHRAGLLKCGKCRKQYTVTVGTLMNRSHIPLNVWVYAFHRLTSSRKGFSAHQLWKDLNLGSYRTAWKLFHKVRLAMRQEPLSGMLKGTIEADETFIGGKPRGNKKPRPGRLSKRGPAPDFKDRKFPVVTVVQRGGEVFARAVDGVTSVNLRDTIMDSVDPSNSRLMTDERHAYRAIGREFAGGHELVHHKLSQWVRRPDIHIQTAESFHAGLQRAVRGTYHHVSRKHLPKYVGEAAYRWNVRKSPEEDRAEPAIRNAMRNIADV
jgi:transposase-like protein